jgi:hypothetical protein
MIFTGKNFSKYLTISLILLHKSLLGFRLLCYTKLILYWFPCLNTSIWPFNIIKKITKFYFLLWSRFFPRIKLLTISIDCSMILALESLNYFISLTTYLKKKHLYIIKQLKILLC